MVKDLFFKHKGERKWGDQTFTLAQIGGLGWTKFLGAYSSLGS